VSNVNAVSQTNAATAAQDPAMTPEEIVAQLRVLRAQIPSYVQLPVSEALTLRTVSNLHPEFAQAAINAVGASPRLEATVGQSAEALQGVAEQAARLSKVADELKAMQEGVSSAILTLKNSLGRAVLLTYVVSKRLVQEPEHKDLLPHLDNMRKTNRLGRSRKKQADTPAPAPVPVSEHAPAPAPGIPSSTQHV